MSTHLGGARRVLGLVASKWTVPVVRCLANGRRRPSELLEQFPRLSQKVLTQTLRRLEEGGLVGREAHATAPPRVDYRLTPLGKSLLEPLDALDAWVREHGKQMGYAMPGRPAKPGKP